MCVCLCMCVWRLRHSLKGLNSVYVIKLKFIIKAAFGLAWLYISPPSPIPTHYCLAYCPHTHTHMRICTQKEAAHVVVLCKLVFKFCDHTNKMSAHTHTDMDNIHMKVGNGHRRSGSSGEGWGVDGFKVFDCVAFARFAASV